MSQARDPLRILVIDDYPDLARSTCEMLRVLGHDCRAATTAREARQRVVDFEPDVIFLDLLVGPSDGQALASELRQTSRYELVMVAFTGFPLVDELIASHAFDHYLRKPANLEQFSHLLGLAHDQLDTPSYS